MANFRSIFTFSKSKRLGLSTLNLVVLAPTSQQLGRAGFFALLQPKEDVSASPTTIEFNNIFADVIVLIYLGAVEEAVVFQTDFVAFHSLGT